MDGDSIHRIGFTELIGINSARKGPYRINILFVHGLRGHPRHTWEEENPDVGSGDTEAATLSKRKTFMSFFKTRPSTPRTDNRTSKNLGTKVFWPKDYLTLDIPEARIWTYGYNADVIGGLFQANNQNSVSQHGRDLAVRVEREIENDDPIVFVVHSLGGIITKDAIRRSDSCRARTKLIVFLGTPHRGSVYAGWGEIASNLACLAMQDSNKEIIKSLQVNSQILDNIHEEFMTIAYQSRFKIHSFQEARGISGMKGLHNKVVDEFSAKLDLPQQLETVESIDANHMHMVRCSNRADPRYRAIAGVLRQFVRSIVLDGNETRPREMPLPRHSAVQALRERLGEWAEEAVDENGHWLQPVLRVGAFEKHLVGENGHFIPSGTCKSTFGWAHLLYALDIRPGRGVLAWRVPTGSVDLTESGQISLEIDGPVMCHIINLYRIYKDPAPHNLSPVDQNADCRLPFGMFSIHREDSLKFDVSFQSGTPEELAMPRVPFSYDVWCLDGDRLMFEKEVVVSRYYNAIHHGVSNTEARLPEPKCSLKERTRALLHSIDILRRKEPGNPFILTASWLEEASRIKRRVSTNGGNDQSLVDTIITALSEMSDVVVQLEKVMWEGDKWEHWVKKALQKKFMFTGDGFNLIWTARSESTSTTEFAVQTIVRKQLPIVLAQLASTATGTWRHTLSEMASDAATLLNTSCEWINCRGVVLELTPESELWMSDFRIRS